MRKDAGKSPLRAMKEALTALGMTVAVAESCTGGLLGSLLTDSPGSSEYFTGGVIAYHNDVKTALLGVQASTLEKYGAVSSQTAREMAEGVRARLKTDFGVSITGVAGPGGGSARKPVGTVYIGVCTSKGAKARKFTFEGGRKAIRKASAMAAIEALTAEIKRFKGPTKGQ